MNENGNHHSTCPAGHTFLSDLTTRIDMNVGSTFYQRKSAKKYEAYQVENRAAVIIIRLYLTCSRCVIHLAAGGELVECLHSKRDSIVGYGR